LRVIRLSDLMHCHELDRRELAEATRRLEVLWSYAQQERCARRSFAVSSGRTQELTDPSKLLPDLLQRSSIHDRLEGLEV
jgi:hypothetical protein